MLDIATVDKLAAKAAGATLHGNNFTKVVSAPTSDWEGHDALHVTVIIKSSAEEDIDGDTAINLISAVQRELQAAGDERFAIISFATEQEWRDDGGS